MEGREGDGNPLHFNRSPETFSNSSLEMADLAVLVVLSRAKHLWEREQELVPRAPFGT